LDFQIVTPVLETFLQKGMFHVRSKPETRESWVEVLKGAARVRSSSKRKKYVALGDHEKTGVKGTSVPFNPSIISQKDWMEMKEAYRFLPRDPQFMERQSRIVREAGSLFLNVSEERAVFDPNLGYFEYQFLKDTPSPSPLPLQGERMKGEGVYLKLEYDVLPAGSFVGMVLETRDLDLGDFSRFSFQARSDAEENSPDTFRIQVKSGQKVLLTFHARRFDSRWQNFAYSFQFPKGTPVSEISFEFSNQDVGAKKRGVLYLRDLTIH